MFPKALTILVVALLGFASSVLALASPSPNTNAARLAQGLPPAAPKFKRFLPGVRDTPTPAFVAKRSNPSTPASVYVGRIQVRSLDGHFNGYVRNAESGFIGGVNFLGSEYDLRVKLFPRGTGPWDIVATNALFKAPLFVGAGGTSVLGRKSRGISALETVYQSPRGSPPIEVQGVTGQSAIWDIDPHTKELTVQYVNPDGSSLKATIAYNIRSNTLFFTGDLSAWNEGNNKPASEVKFFLVS